MFDLDIDFDSAIPHVIDAFTHVFGEEYRDIITKRVNRTTIIYYKDPTHINGYISHLKRCKKRELYIRFLDELGYDVEKYKTNNYTQSLGVEEEKILDDLIHSSYAFDDDADYWSPIRAFDSNNETGEWKLTCNKLKIINFLLPADHNVINENDLESFMQTEEYSNLLKRISEIRTIYDKLYEEFQEWYKNLDSLNKYVEDEKKRKEDIYKQKGELLFKKLYSKIPQAMKKIIADKPIEEQIKLVLGGNDLDGFTYLEAFREKCMNRLHSPSGDLQKKDTSMWYQLMYLNHFGIVPEDLEYKEFKNESDVKKYLDRISQDDIKDYIPPVSFVRSYLILKKKLAKEAEYDYNKTRPDILSNKKLFADTEDNFKNIYNVITKKYISIFSYGGTNSETNEFFSIMNFGKRDPGVLAYDLLHEFGHVISQTRGGCVGLEESIDYQDGSKVNPYRKDKRLHERLNETINDIFAIEANEYLRSKNIYLIEPYEITRLDSSDDNTGKVVKKALMPLVQGFRKVLIKAIIDANPSELTKYIGKDNYEELNDAINKVDNLVYNGLERKLEKNENCSLVSEYNKELKRIKQIYLNMYNYYQTNFGNKRTNKGIKIKELIR